MSPESMRVTVRLRDVKLELVGDSDSPVATLIKSGALDLSKPGNLVGFLPQRPPLLLEARDDRFVVDLMKVPKLAENAKVQRILAALGEVLRVRGVRVEQGVGEGLLVISVTLRPTGLPAALAALRG